MKKFIANLIALPGDLLGIFIEDIIVYYHLMSKGYSFKKASKIYDRLVTIRAISAVRDYYGDRNISMRDVRLRIKSQTAA